MALSVHRFNSWRQSQSIVGAKLLGALWLRNQIFALNKAPPLDQGMTR